MKSESCWIKSDDGTPLFVHQWAPEEKPRRILHIAHGLGEHAGRYARFAEALTGRGYIVFGNDHRGHGRTAGTKENLGFFAMQDGWNRTVRDLKVLIDAEREKFPGLPVFLLGHSMGSFMAQQFFYEYGPVLAGGLLSGSNGEPEFLVHGLRLLARLERIRIGRRSPSRLLHRLSLHVANRQFQPIRTDFDWICSVTAEVDKYLDDPYCGFVGSAQLWNDLLDATLEMSRPRNQARIPKELPIYIFAGRMDPVSGNCRGLEQLLSAYRRAGLRNVQHKFYPGGRHEMLNEAQREEVVADLLSWLERIA